MRIIKVENCFKCPCNIYSKSDDDHEVDCNVGGGDYEYDVTKYYDNKTQPKNCPLEDVQGIIRKVGEPND